MSRTSRPQMSGIGYETGDLPENKFSLMTDYDLGTLLSNLICTTATQHLQDKLLAEVRKRQLIR